MNHSETKPILYEIECPLCHSVFTRKFTPDKPLTARELKSSETVKQTKECPICKKEITYELPAVLVPREEVVRGKVSK